MKKKKRLVIGVIMLLALLLVGFVTVKASQDSKLRKEIEIGNKYLSEGRYEEAILAFEKIIEVDPKNVEARVGLAKAYVGIKQYGKAEKVLTDGIKLTAKKPLLYTTLADVYLEQNKIDEAIATLDEGYSKTKDRTIKDKLDSISKELEVIVDTNPLQVKNKTNAKLIRKDSTGAETLVTAKWSVKDSDIGEIKESENKQAVYTGLSGGQDVIIAKAGSIEKTQAIEVKESIVTSIEIVSQSTTGTVGDSVEFKAIVKDQLGNEMNVEPTWAIEGDFATMASSQGLVNKFDYVKDGTGKITASVGDVKSTVDVTVEKKKFTIVTVVSGKGTVTKDPKKDTYVDGEEINLQAVPNEGWQFKSWAGDVSGSKNPIKIVMNSNKNIKAIFEAKQFTLNTQTVGNGSITRSEVKDKYSYGTKVTVTAVPKEGWVFDHWEGDLTNKNSQNTITMNSNKNITAVFVEKHYNVNIEKVGQGEVEKVESPRNTYKLTAKAAEGWKFDHWEGSITGTTNPVTITCTSDKNVKAVFVESNNNLNVTSEGMGSVERQTSDGINYTLKAIPAEGWIFDHWDGDLKGNQNPAQIKADVNKNVKAVFVKKQYTVKVSAKGNGTVTIKDPKDVYSYGDQVTITAAPATQDWVFSGWTGDATGNANPNVITVNGDKQIQGVFDLISVKGTVKNGKTGATMDNVTLKVRAGEGETGRAGDVIQTATTNGAGEYQLVSLPEGMYTIEISKDGFITNYETVQALGDRTTRLDSSLMPKVSGDVYRFRLSWGQTPSDLDLHMYEPVFKSEISYSNPADPEKNAQLDVDDTDGFGPETITINEQAPGFYQLFVHNYSGQVALINSSAKIEVFKGNDIVKVINVPTAATGEGAYWNVLELHGDRINEINTIGDKPQIK